MSAWSVYADRMAAQGISKRTASLKREEHMLDTKLRESLSYHTAIIEGEPHNVAIVNSDNLNEKTLFTREPGLILGGELVEWMDNKWLVTEVDFNSEIYTKALLVQCNYLLKWVDADDIIHEQWCIISDGTKYLTGEYEDRNFVVRRGDSRIAMVIARNKDTAKFERENRFLIDDPESPRKLAYLLTKPLKVGAVYNGHGVYSFVLQEVVSTANDNHELAIADYYKHFPRDEQSPETGEDSPPQQEDKPEDFGEVWL